MVDACIEWVGSRNKANYGTTTAPRRGRIRPALAHRVAYCEFHGIDLSAIDGLVIRHSCDNPPCVNPNHLIKGTHADNANDKVSRGRQTKGIGFSSAKLDAEKVSQIRALYIPRNAQYGARALARKFKVTHQLISGVIRHAIWTHIKGNTVAKLTIEQIKARIAADTAKLAELESAERAASTLSNLAAGDVIDYMYGRGETRKQYAGVVNGVADTDKGKRIKVTTGEGFDVEIHVIDPSAIVGPVDSDAAQGVVGGAEVDPLASIQ